MINIQVNFARFVLLFLSVWSAWFGLHAVGYQRRVLFNPAWTNAAFPTADAHSGKLAVSNPLLNWL